MKKADNFDAGKWLVENKLTAQSRLNENKIPGVNVEIDGNYVELFDGMFYYTGFIKDNGTISFSVIYEDEDHRDGMEFNDKNWKDILGDNHVFVKIAKAIPTKVEAMGDYVMITVKADNLTSMNESRLNEGFMDMFSNPKPTDTFQGSSQKEFIKWAKSVFDSRKIPSSKSSYWLNDVADGNWDNSYDGISQDDLVHDAFAAWFPEYQIPPYSDV